MTKTFNELQKKGKKINFREFKAIALGKDEEEPEVINRRDSNIIISVNEGEKNVTKQITFKERDSKDYQDKKITDDKIFNNKDKNEMILNDNKKKFEEDKKIIFLL